MKILVLGTTGMLGNAVFRYFSDRQGVQCIGTLRNTNGLSFFPTQLQHNLIANIDVLNQEDLARVLAHVKPEVVINCVGVIKQLASASDPLVVLPINSLLPHRLANLCALAQARLIHISTDCVFSGRKGSYLETDISDAEDLYGKSKYLGEIADQDHVVTLRTSIIGHELNSNHALVDWFLAQSKPIKGYSQAIYTGLPTFELAKVIAEYVLPNPNLAGLYQVASNRINKYDLLHLIADVYGKNISIERDDSVKIDRSLIGSRFTECTGYKAPDWPTLVQTMHQSQGFINV